jgi:hypothetical protein
LLAPHFSLLLLRVLCALLPDLSFFIAGSLASLSPLVLPCSRAAAQSVPIHSRHSTSYFFLTAPFSLFTP